MELNHIDEINIYNNGDGSYALEMYMSTSATERAILKIPRTPLRMNISSICIGEMEIELKLEGAIESRCI
jgi:hypothetical protein